jgi:hypothetical protein
MTRRVVLFTAAGPRADGGWRGLVGLPDERPGVESGLPALLGLPRLARGRLEAAARGVAVGDGEGAWCLDLLPAGPPSPAELARLREALGQLDGTVWPLDGSRLLLTGPAWWGDAPPGPHQTTRPLHELAIGPFGGVAKAARTALRPRLAWPWGTLGTAALPTPRHRPALVVAGATSPVAGLAQLLAVPCRAAPPAEVPGGLTVVHLPAPAIASGADVVVVCPVDAAGRARGAVVPAPAGLPDTVPARDLLDQAVA